MRAILMTIGLMLIAGAAHAAAPFTDPKALIDYAYAPYFNDEFPEDPTEIYSPTLKQLWDTMAEKSQEADVPIIDFDPLINAQDYEIKDFVIADPVVEGDTALLVASFTNFGEPQEIHFELVRTTEGWLIDDIESVGAYAWRLSELLAADPMLN